jgi:hypothetical protein
MSTFSMRDLSVLNYANGFTGWHYKARDIQAPGFFDDAADIMKIGDHVAVSSPYGGAMLALVTPAKPHRTQIVFMCFGAEPKPATGASA